MAYTRWRAGWAIVVMALVGLVGCGDDDASINLSVDGQNGGQNGGDEGGTPPASTLLYCQDDAPALDAGRVDTVTQSTDIDGQTIDVAMTLYTPALEEGECAPLIVHSHGFGGSRITNLDDVADDSNASDVATRNAWQSGYFVVSFDQRGFGETGGSVKVENPDFEGRDTRAVIDHAIEQFEGHLAYRRGEPVIGALGLSYGGGFQLVGAGVDPRIDAIVPAATWYDLTYSLAPNDTPKTVWLDLLVLLGVVGAEGALDPFLYEGFLQAQFGNISDDILTEVRGNGLNAFCEGLRPSEGVPRVDAFFVQGVNDTHVQHERGRA
ncbi:Putative ABC transporter ATP-binding protein [Salinisphaera shabanensis E1L3A]|uniref:ABC transporter ATP-binding protein n=1 Tax=Salinisphaera shabanensis E1L3A TaxID=1033802 RepID=U2FV71_9GAMM|nr:CocE/NonD family hydrolase [Salinisphaera shabanensis]ERJ19819.1 Putative ABC transporter ATP-binding protein [Salinisphaera shabanensis E1L3A]